MNTETSSEDYFHYNQGIFVDRDHEINLFMKTVRATDKTKYLEFIGVSGQGKTELLRWIFKKSREEGFLSAYLDFANSLFQRPEIYPILEAAAAQLSETVDEAPFQSFREILPKYKNELKNFYKASWLSDSIDPKPYTDIEKELIDSFSASLDAIAKKSVIVLCMDSSEKAYDRSFREFENNILSKYSNNSNFMIVTAGQTPIKWEAGTFPIASRNIIKPTHLNPFDKQSAIEQIEQITKHRGFKVSKLDEIGNKLFAITLGHPFSNFELVDYCLKSESEIDFSPELVEEKLNGGIRSLVKGFIEKQILESVYIDQNLYPSAVEILMHLSPLRNVELEIVSFILSKFLSGWFSDKPFYHILRLFGNLTNSFTFSQWQMGSGYTMEPVVKNILLHDLKQNHYEKYVIIQQAINGKYGDEVKKARDDSQIKYIVERLYHHACFLLIKNTQNITIIIEEELESFLRSFAYDYKNNPQKGIQYLLDLENMLEKEKTKIFGIAALGTDINIDSLLNKTKKYKEKIMNFQNSL